MNQFISILEIVRRIVGLVPPSTQSEPAKEISVLVVDDEESTLIMIGHCIDKLGRRIRYETRQSIASARQLLATKRFDVLLLDVVFPARGGVLEDGIAFYHEVTRTWPEMKVVFVTGNAQRVIDELPGQCVTLVAKRDTYLSLYEAISDALKEERTVPPVKPSPLALYLVVMTSVLIGYLLHYAPAILQLLIQ